MWASRSHAAACVATRESRSRATADGMTPALVSSCVQYIVEVLERSRSKSSTLEKIRSKLANPVELTGFDRG